MGAPYVRRPTLLLADPLFRYHYPVGLGVPSMGFRFRRSGRFADRAMHMKEPLKVHFDGKFIGEVPQTGDRETDLKAMSALLCERGVAAPLTRCQATFRQASAFATNASYLFSSGLTGVPPRNPMNVIPFVVNAALAVELYLKTLGCVYDLKMHGHDLLDLFDELPAKAKERLRLEIAKAPATEGIKDLIGFRTEIERARHLFIEWRYLYERDSASEVRFVEFIHILNVLHNTCRTDDRLKPATTGEATGAAAPAT